MKSGVLTGLLFFFTTIQLMAQGQLHPDSLFGQDGLIAVDVDSVHDFFRTILVQDNGQILIAGHLHASWDLYGNPYRDSIAVVRLNSDGTLDNSFGTNGVASASTPDPVIAEVEDMVIQSDGMILTCGMGMEQGGRPCFSMARFNENGTVDTDFGQDGTVLTQFTDKWAGANNIHAYGNGAILLAGNVHPDTSDLADFALAKYLPNGAIDSSFGINGTVHTDFGMNYDDRLKAIWMFEDGRILAVGNSAGKVELAKYHSDGTLDATFGSDGLLILNDSLYGSIYVYDVEVIDDGNILVGGTSNIGGSSSFTLMRCLSNGSLDTTFGNGGIETLGWPGGHNLNHLYTFNSDIYATGGYYDGTNDYLLIAKLNSDGTYNTAFGEDGLATGIHGGAYSIAIQPDGKLLSLGRGTGYYFFDAIVARYDAPTTGLRELNANPDLILFPNPTTSTVSLQSKISLSQAWLTDLIGHRLMPLQLNGIQWQADLTTLPGGIYLVKAFTKDGAKAVSKVVKL